VADSRLLRDRLMEHNDTEAWSRTRAIDIIVRPVGQRASVEPCWVTVVPRRAADKTSSSATTRWRNWHATREGAGRRRVWQITTYSDDWRPTPACPSGTASAVRSLSHGHVNAITWWRCPGIRSICLKRRYY